MNLLYFLVSWDYEFVKRALSGVIETDEFTRRMMDIYTHIHNEGIVQTKVVQIQRSDYMCHSEANGTTALKQVRLFSSVVKRNVSRPISSRCLSI